MLVLKFQFDFDNFGKRFCAYTIDIAILYSVFAVLSYLNRAIGLFSPYTFGGISYLASVLYFAFMESGEYKATLGKRILGLVVIQSNTGEAVSFKRAAVRNVVRLVNIPICCLGYLPILFTAKQQGLHDFVAHTRAVDIEEAEQLGLKKADGPYRDAAK